MEGLEDEETLLELLDAGVSRAILTCDDSAAAGLLDSLLQRDHSAAAAAAAASSFPIPAARLAVAITVQDDGDDAAASPRVVRCGSRLQALLGDAQPPLTALMTRLQRDVAEFVVCPASNDRPPSAALLAALQDWHSTHPAVRLTLRCEAAATAEAVHALSALGLHSSVTVCTAAACRSASGLSVEAVGGWLGSVVARHCRSDRADGLVSTVVVDDGGVALGLVYSSHCIAGRRLLRSARRVLVAQQAAAVAEGRHVRLQPAPAAGGARLRRRRAALHSGAGGSGLLPSAALDLLAHAGQRAAGAEPHAG